MAGNPVLDRAKAHFRGVLNEPLGRVIVPEWGEDDRPLEIHVWQSNMRQRGKVKDAIHKGGEWPTMAVCQYAKDADGKRLFADAEYDMLALGTDPLVIERVAGEILDMQKTDSEQTAGN